MIFLFHRFLTVRDDTRAVPLNVMSSVLSRIVPALLQYTYSGRHEFIFVSEGTHDCQAREKLGVHNVKYN